MSSSGQLKKTRIRLKNATGILLMFCKYPEVEIPSKQSFQTYFFSYLTSGDVRAIGTYLIFLPSSNDVIYFSSKNNTRLSFPSINNDVNYYPSKKMM